MWQRLFAWLLLVAFAVSMVLERPVPLAIGP